MNLTKSPLANLEAAEEFKLLVLERVNARAKQRANEKTLFHYRAQQLLGGWAFKHLPGHILQFCTYELSGLNFGTIIINYENSTSIVIELTRMNDDSAWQRSPYFVSSKDGKGEEWNDGSLSTDDLIEACVLAIEQNSL